MRGFSYHMDERSLKSDIAKVADKVKEMTISGCDLNWSIEDVDIHTKEKSKVE